MKTKPQQTMNLKSHVTFLRLEHLLIRDNEKDQEKYENDI